MQAGFIVGVCKVGECAGCEVGVYAGRVYSVCRCRV